MRIVLSFLLLFTFCIDVQAATQTQTIAVVVNEDAISERDVNDRLMLIIRSSGMQDTKEIRQNLRDQITKNLIEEQIKIQEAERLEIAISDEEIDSGFEKIAQQNNMSAEKFSGMLKRSGLNADTMRRQIKSQIAWSKVIAQELRPQVNISEADVDDAVERIRSNIGKIEYQLAEIFLPVEKPSEEKNVRDLANRLSIDIREKRATFFQVARQFSKSAGASRGGDLGWVQQSALSDEFKSTLKTMSENSVSTPIKSVAGYHILFLRGKRSLSEDTMPSKPQVAQNLGLERLERLQRQYLLDLKANAFIDMRV